MAASDPNRDILFTAFEPSGDALAAPMITRLLEQHPGLRVWALGGPKMLAAGADLIETTTDNPAMLLGAASQARAHQQRLKRLTKWLNDHKLAALVPVDSPAANWSICKLVRKTQPAAKIIHLAAPQLWAWAPWRIKKLRRLTDHVLCLLPFEPDWFTARGVRATFVGHPLFDPSLQSTKPSGELPDWPTDGQPKIALLPGSRPGEIRANWPTMIQTFSTLLDHYGQAQGLVAVADTKSQTLLDQTTDSFTHQHNHLTTAVGQTDAALDWADVVIVVSGTATLQVAAHRKPMVVLYNVSRWAWNLYARWLITTRTFSLPNLIIQANGHNRPVPEFIPHFRAVSPIVQEVERIIDDPAARQQQFAAFHDIENSFSNQSFADEASKTFTQLIA